ncbi:MAG: hypothetical protein MR913_13195 [Clostridiales bacterium]|nr:hypothetical protein [Clostridiales bacterium]
MKPTAVVYTSNTGYTAQYASLLGGETGLPVYSLAEAEQNLAQGTPVIYLGWLAAGTVRGYARAAKRFDLRALCAVGMGACGSQTEDVRRANALPGGASPVHITGGL